ncbi:hypothetical protein MIMGU_mgv1a018587mg, partial [Erythranthe guttata]
DDALTRLPYTSSHHPGAYRFTRSMKTQTELAHPFGHRDARTNPNNQPFFLSNLPPARQDRGTPEASRVRGGSNLHKRRVRHIHEKREDVS